MRIIKKFGQYINEGHRSAKDMNPDIFPEDGEEDILPPGKDINGDDFESDPDVERDQVINDLDDEEFDDTISEDEPQEEEETDYKGGQMMKELARKLGVEIENNEIHYGGQTVTCPSEDDIFRIGKRKFRSVSDIFSYLKGSGKQVDAPVTESKKITCNCCPRCKGKGGCNCRSCKCKKK